MTSTVIEHVALYIDGHWRQPHATAQTDVIRQMGSVPDPGEVDIDRGHRRPHRVRRPLWVGSMGSSERATVMNAFADALEKRANRLAELVNDQNGSPFSIAHVTTDSQRDYVQAIGTHVKDA